MSTVRIGYTTQEIDLGPVGLTLNDFDDMEFFEEVAYLNDREHLILKKDISFHVYEPHYSYYRNMYLYEVYFELKELDFDSSFITIDKSTLEASSEMTE